MEAVLSLPRQQQAPIALDDRPANEGTLRGDKGEPRAKAKPADCRRKEQMPTVSTGPFRDEPVSPLFAKPVQGELFDLKFKNNRSRQF